MKGDIFDYAQAYYERELKNKYNASAISYLKDRVFEKETIKTFGLGVSPSRRGLCNFLTANGFTIEEATEKGLIGAYGDRMQNRVVIPIKDFRGNTVAFAGRKINHSKDDVKYINTPNYIDFVKGATVFNLDKAKRYIDYNNNDYVILVEGYFDVISLWENGVKNAVCSMGTALTKRQARLIKMHTPNVVVCYDGDDVGYAATNKAVQILTENGLKPHIATLPNGNDVDEFIKNYSIEEYQNLILKSLESPNGTTN